MWALRLHGEVKDAKPGYTVIVVRESVRNALEELGAQGYRSIKISSLKHGSRVNPKGINGEIRRSRNESEIGFFLKKAIQNFGAAAGI